MNKIALIAVAVLLGGCSLFESVGTGDPVRDIQVTVSEGKALYDAMMSAANRHHWTVTANADGAYRLSHFQRKNRCIVDVTLNGNESFSILPVESNIPVRKYDQWVDNLRREIIFRASR